MSCNNQRVSINTKRVSPESRKQTAERKSESKFNPAELAKQISGGIDTTMKLLHLARSCGATGSKFVKPFTTSFRPGKNYGHGCSVELSKKPRISLPRPSKTDCHHVLSLTSQIRSERTYYMPDSQSINLWHIASRPLKRGPENVATVVVLNRLHTSLSARINATLTRRF